MDIELAVHAMELAGEIDEMVLFSGDGDFRPLVEAVQRRGVRVAVVSSIASQPPMRTNYAARRIPFIDLTELRAKVGRDPSERPPPPERREIRPPQFQQRVPVASPRGDIDELTRVVRFK